MADSLGAPLTDVETTRSASPDPRISQSQHPSPPPSSIPRLPSVLFTGFSVFPGAPLNPTEHLLPILQSAYQAGHYSDLCSSFSTEIFPVEYASLPARLSIIAGKRPLPDIVVHFGLDGSATGIKLERVARNSCAGHPDNTGQCVSGRIVAGEDPAETEEVIPSRLPLDAIYQELERRGIPAQWSDDAGGYLCNYIFYLSASASREKACPEWQPGMVGFIHVPPLAERMFWGGRRGMEMEVIRDAAEAILEVCCREWMERRRVAVQKGEWASGYPHIDT